MATNKKKEEAMTAVGRTARRKSARTVRLMKESGRYSDAYLMQVDLLSRTMAQLDTIEKEKSRRGYQIVIGTLSREGNDRPIINPLETLYADYLDRAQRALKALGMNADSKERKDSDAPGLDEFLKEIRDN